MADEYKIGIIGDRAGALGFLALGFDLFEAGTPEEAAAQLRRAAGSGEYAVLFLDEALAEAIPEELARWQDKLLPAVTVLPGKTGTGYGMRRLHDAVARAVGADILPGDGA